MLGEYIIVLGTAQDGGYPHIGCDELCCLKAEKDLSIKRFISSIAIVDKKNEKFWIIDITPNISSQLRILKEHIRNQTYPNFSGIFLTHAHMGHYTGLLKLGLEAMNSFKIPVFVMPKMKLFLENNSMFKQLIINKNIILKEIKEKRKFRLNNNVSISTFCVPHRNELSETVGYKICGLNKKIIFIPDIDMWDNQNMIDLVKNHDILLLDGTFYTKEEIKKRNINKIPHPSIEDSMRLMKKINNNERKKIFFTHLNHTNAVLDKGTIEYKNVITSGYNILEDRQIFTL
jgi:pyrroloquinoline quinone biosynthesis protein B